MYDVNLKVLLPWIVNRKVENIILEVRNWYIERLRLINHRNLYTEPVFATQSIFQHLQDIQDETRNTVRVQ